MEYKCNSGEMRAFCKKLLVKAGMPDSRSDDIADILVESDMQGHPTHGLKLLPAYLKEIKAGKMNLTGEPVILADKGSSMLLDGKYLPGPWLVMEALRTGFSRLEKHPTFTVSIRHSHHIACLGAYLKKATDRGLVCIIMSSDPNNRSVSPFGGYTPTYSPNPIGAGIPTKGDPILIDMSTSSTANGVVAKYKEEGKQLPFPWLLSNKGEASRDPADFFATPPGSLLPLGGLDLGYKGFALGILVEALTSALGGFGRADGASQWGGSVFIQLIDPAGFGGRDAFARETSFFAGECAKSAVMPGKSGVYMPGYFELRKREQQEKNGLALSKEIMVPLEACSAEYGIPLPKSI